MKKLLKLIFLVHLLTEPVMGRYKEKDIEWRLTIIEDKLDFEFEELIHVQTKPLYAGFKDLKQVISVPLKEHKLEIEDIQKSQISLLLTNADQENSIQRLNDTLNDQHNDMQAQLVNINNDFINKLKGVATEIETKCDGKIKSLVTEMESKFNDKFKDIATQFETRLNQMTAEVNILKQNLQYVCPPGWHKNFYKCFYLNENLSTWGDALNYCASAGGRLVEYNNSQEMDFVLYLALSSKVDWGTSEWNGFWIGGNDIQSEGHFIWEGSKHSVPSWKWHYLQPDNYSNEDCMMTLVNRDGHWNDATCHGNLRSVCEKRLP